MCVISGSSLVSTCQRLSPRSTTKLTKHRCRQSSIRDFEASPERRHALSQQIQRQLREQRRFPRPGGSRQNGEFPAAMPLERPVEEGERQEGRSLQLARMDEVVEHVLPIIPTGRFTGFELGEGEDLLVRETPRALDEPAQIQPAPQTVAGVLHPAGGVVGGVGRRHDADAALPQFAGKAQRALLVDAVEVHPEHDLLDGLQPGQQTHRQRGGSVGQGDRGQPGGLVHRHGVVLALRDHQRGTVRGDRVPAEEAPLAPRGLQTHVGLGLDGADLVAVHERRGALQRDPGKHHAVLRARRAVRLHEGLRTRAHAVLAKRVRGQPAPRRGARCEGVPDAGEAVVAEIGDVLLYFVVGKLVKLLAFAIAERSRGGRGGIGVR